MKNTRGIGPFLTTVAAALTVAGAEMTIVETGAPRAAIVIADRPTVAAQFAAFELQHHVRLISGATLPIKHPDDGVEGIRILVGEPSATEALMLPGDTWSEQEYLVAVRTDVIALLGHDAERYDDVKYGDDDPFAFRTWPDFFEPHATCFAVYDFLEHCCNVRWFRPGKLGMTYPRQETLRVKLLEQRRAPAFLYREPSHYARGNSEGWDAGTGLWNRTRDGARVRRLEHVLYPELTARWGCPSWKYTHAKRGVVRLFLHRLRAGGEQYACNHSFYGYYDRFLDKSSTSKRTELFERPEPDWFAKGYEGQPPQMCFTNPEFTEQVIEDANAYFDGKGKRPRAQAAGDYFALVPMDNSRYCKCPRCRALERPDSPGEGHFSNGRWSNLVFDFANRVAREAGKKYPDRILSTLAYASYAYPPDFPVEPNISVGFCLHIRNCWSASITANDHRLLKAWRDLYPDRRYFLFVYYCFPVENARDRWFCFPGFFAHSLAREIALYHESNVRGAYFCGFGQDVEAYVTLKLLDDPTLNVDRLLRDYFGRLFGPAAEPLRQFYLTVERIYCNPRSYPRGFRSHQTEQVAWENLGSSVRVAHLGELIAEARRLAAEATEVEQQRLAGFEQSFWDYIRTGYQRYSARQWSRLQKRRTPPAIPVVPSPIETLTADTFARFPAMTLRWQPDGQPTETTATVHLAHDGEQLYAWCRDDHAHTPPGHWELLFALRRQSPGRRCRVSPDGAIMLTEADTGKVVKTSARLLPAPGDQGILLAIPLAELTADGMEPGWNVCLQAVRQFGPERYAMNRPNAIGCEDPALLGSCALAPLPAPKDTHVPAYDLPKAADRKPKSLGPGVTLTSHDIAQLHFATDDLLQGRPFVFSSEGGRAYYFYRGQYKQPKCLGLSDACSPRTPVFGVMPQGAPTIHVTWELDEQSAGSLSRLRLWISVADPARPRAKVQFSVRGTDGKWQTITPVIGTPRDRHPEHTYHAITADLKPDAVPRFNAIRMTDLLGSYNPRYVELDAFSSQTTSAK